MSLLRNYTLYHKKETKYSYLIEAKHKTTKLLFESNILAELSPKEFEEIVCHGYTKILDFYGCLGVYHHYQRHKRIDHLVLVSACMSAGKMKEFEVFKISAVSVFALNEGLHNGYEDDNIMELKKLLSSGVFYFARYLSGSVYDLTVCEQKRFLHESISNNKDSQMSDDRFLWNKSLWHRFQVHKISRTWLLKMVCGGFEMRTVYAGKYQALCAIFSRLSNERAGRRFLVRGVDEHGHVANFVETEQVIYVDRKIVSHIQIRGSVPLFWQQVGKQVGAHKVTITCPETITSVALNKHLSQLSLYYNKVTLVNLMGMKKGEGLLSRNFREHMNNSSYSKVMAFIEFDYHIEVGRYGSKAKESLLSKLKPFVQESNIFFIDDSEIQSLQNGIIRTNCVDCLDRTNALQSVIGTAAVLPSQLNYLGLSEIQNIYGRFLDCFQQIWQSTGDCISRIYAGTGALGGGKSKLTDASRSATRTFQNNFLDQGKQIVIDSLLNNSVLTEEYNQVAKQLLPSSILHLPESFLMPMTDYYREYCDITGLSVFVGTWNINGGKHFHSVAHKHESVADWLLDLPKITQRLRPDAVFDSSNQYLEKPYDIYAIGFEEMVDLTAKNFVSVETKNQQEWCRFLLKLLSSKSKYTLLTSIPLMGICLFIFVKSHLLKFIRDLSKTSVKTGFKGAAGNKGAVAVRFRMFDTSICFVCSHFAAGQSNYKDRNSDYQDISSKLIFPGNYIINSHDYVFWFGDFNYRINLPIEEVKRLICDKDWPALQQSDQLNCQRAEGHVFGEYYEAPLLFPPTYKYDMFSEDYDTSEKERIPAWTDRILWKCRTITSDCRRLACMANLLLYSRAELKTSDHRPVGAIFSIDIFKVSSAKRTVVFRQHLDGFASPDNALVMDFKELDTISDELLELVITEASAFGDLLMVRIPSQALYLYFADNKAALQALHGLPASSSLEAVASFTVRPLPGTDWKDQLTQATLPEEQEDRLQRSILVTDVNKELLSHCSTDTTDINELSTSQAVEDEIETDPSDLEFLHLDDELEDGNEVFEEADHSNRDYDAQVLDAPEENRFVGLVHPQCERSLLSSLSKSEIADLNVTENRATRTVPPRPPPPSREVPVENRSGTLLLPRMTDVAFYTHSKEYSRSSPNLKDINAKPNITTREALLIDFGDHADQVTVGRVPPPIPARPPTSLMVSTQGTDEGIAAEKSPDLPVVPPRPPRRC